MEHLAKRKIIAESINSKMGEKDRKRVMADLSCKAPETRFLYVTPEQVIFSLKSYFYDSCQFILSFFCVSAHSSTLPNIL